MNRSCITQRGLVLLLLVSTFCPAIYADFRPEQRVIMENETKGPTSVYAADLDGDSDLDVLSASELDNKIAWYENERMPCTILTSDGSTKVRTICVCGGRPQENRAAAAEI